MDQQSLQIAEQFTTYYYQLFCQNRAGMADLYQPKSILSFEGDLFQGPQGIIGKLTSLNFGQLQIAQKARDIQPIPDGILICVTGDLSVDNEPNPLKFAQVPVLLLPCGSAPMFDFGVWRWADRIVYVFVWLGKQVLCCSGWLTRFVCVCVLQTFILRKSEQGQFWIENDIFRLNIG